MSTDLRDPDLRAALEAAVTQIDPDPEKRVATILHRGGLRRSRRLGALGAGVAVFVAALGWAAIAIERQRTVMLLDPATWQTYRDHQLGWSMGYPSGWRLQTFDEGGFRGVLVSNVEFEFRHPELEDTVTTAWDMRGLAPKAVVVQFQYLLPRLQPEGQPDTVFPLSLDDARRVRDPDSYGAPQPRLWLPVVFNGNPGYAVFAWFAPEASERDRAIAERIVGSISFDSDPPSAKSTEPFAIWPEDTPEEAQAGHRYKTAERLVTAFARDVLGWQETRVSIAEPGHGGPTAYAVERGDGPIALVMADQRVEQIWSVVNVSVLEPNLGFDPPMSVDIREETATFHIDRLEAETLEFRIGYGTGDERQTVAGPGVSEVTIDLSGIDRTRPGHLLILFREADGRVFLAQGFPLPAGDYAEG